MAPGCRAGSDTESPVGVMKSSSCQQAVSTALRSFSLTLRVLAWSDVPVAAG